MGRVEAWDRREDETEVAYEAFALYRDLGVERTVQGVADRLSKSSTLMNRWSNRHNWVDRCLAWDRRQESIRSRVSKQRRVNWERRRLRLRNESYDIARMVVKQAKEMLEAPLWEDVIDEPSGMKVRRPAKWTKGTIAQLLTVMIALAKFATEDGLDELLTFDPEKATKEECREWVAQVKTKVNAYRGVPD